MLNHLVIAGLDKSDLSNMAVVTITGLLIVFSALVLLIFIIGLFGKTVGASGKKNKTKAVKAAPEKKLAPKAAMPAPAAKAVPAAGNDDIIAVIAAAVAVYGESEGKTYAVRNVRRAAAQSGRSAWASAGVMENNRSFIVR